jgi:hypothetical protein
MLTKKWILFNFVQRKWLTCTPNTFCVTAYASTNTCAKLWLLQEMCTWLVTYSCPLQMLCKCSLLDFHSWSVGTNVPKWWQFKDSREPITAYHFTLLITIVCTLLSDSKDSCLSFTGDFASVVSLWHKQAVQIIAMYIRYLSLVWE